MAWVLDPGGLYGGSYHDTCRKGKGAKKRMAQNSQKWSAKGYLWSSKSGRATVTAYCYLQII